jgi:hypothetical protein
MTTTFQIKEKRFPWNPRRKDKQDKIKDIQQTGNVDYLANDFNCEKLLLENTIKIEIFGSDKYTLEQRLDAQKKWLRKC